MRIGGAASRRTSSSNAARCRCRPTGCRRYETIGALAREAGRTARATRRTRGRARRSGAPRCRRPRPRHRRERGEHWDRAQRWKHREQVNDVGGYEPLDERRAPAHQVARELVRSRSIALYGTSSRSRQRPRRTSAFSWVARATLEEPVDQRGLAHAGRAHDDDRDAPLRDACERARRATASSRARPENTGRGAAGSRRRRGPSPRRAARAAGPVGRSRGSRSSSSRTDRRGRAGCGGPAATAAAPRSLLSSNSTRSGPRTAAARSAPGTARTPSAYQSAAGLSDVAGALLGRHVARRCRRSRVLARWRRSSSATRPKSSSTTRPARDLDVRRLDVAMDLAGGVQRGEPARQLGSAWRSRPTSQPGTYEPLDKPAGVRRRFALHDRLRCLDQPSGPRRSCRARCSSPSSPRARPARAPSRAAACRGPAPS